MLNLLKQFEGKDFASFDKRFKRSLFYLTLFYSIILGLILLFSASVTYSAFSSRIGPRFDHPPVFNTDQMQIIIMDRRGPTISEVRDDLFSALIFVDGVIFIFAIILSYFLAKMTLRPLKKSYHEQRRFIADASHELRTPLAIMRAELENELGSSHLSEDRREKLTSHLEEVDRMNKIVQDLLMLSKLESRQAMSLSVRPTDISAVIRETIKRSQNLAESNKVKLIFDELSVEGSDVVGSNGVFILGNEQVSHILMNLIQNAILYNKPDGTVNVSIIPDDSSVKSLETESFVSVLVRDSGIGIRPDDLERIFDRFYRVDKSRSRKTGGNGLGLSIVRRGVEVLGGQISIDSEWGEGTTVKVSFPKATNIADSKSDKKQI